MDPTGWVVIAPEEAIDIITARGSSWGWVGIKQIPNEKVAVISAVSTGDDRRYPTPLPQAHRTTRFSELPRGGIWYRVEPELHIAHTAVMNRGTACLTDAIKGLVRQGWKEPHVEGRLTITYSETDDDEPALFAWWVTPDEGLPMRLCIVGDSDPIDHLRGVWPVDDLENKHAVIVGTGSIGSTAAEALATSGIGSMTLVDPDRLYPHNLIRHRLTALDLGRHKVIALAEALKVDHPSLIVDPVVADVAVAADRMRPLFSAADIVVCCSDGVESRRVTNHVARRAGTPLVLAAVLENGAVGELVRVRPQRGCLLCLRRQSEADGTFDPEPNLDRGYGTGSVHLPMTAAPPDLRLMGELAAKAAIATLLEAAGWYKQQLPGDWMQIGLQPLTDTPAPFDGLRAGGVRWSEMVNRDEGCPTCAAP